MRHGTGLGTRCLYKRAVVQGERGGDAVSRIYQVSKPPRPQPIREAPNRA